MFSSKKPYDYRRWWAGYSKGWQNGAREATDELRQKIIENLLADAVISTNTDVRWLARVVEIIDES